MFKLHSMHVCVCVLPCSGVLGVCMHLQRLHNKDAQERNVLS